MRSQRRSQFEHDHRRRADRVPQITASFTRETGDGLTGTYIGESLNRVESVPKWSRGRRARADLREVYRRDKAMRS